MDTIMTNRSMPPLGHPLELIPFFRRWPPSMRRNLLYTLIWNCGLGALLTAMEIALVHDRKPLLGYLLPMLLISNLIGFMIHGGSMLANSLTDGRSGRMRGLPRLMFSICLVGSSVLLGLGLGNALLSGKNPFELLANRSVLLQSLVLAVAIALVMYWVRGSAEKRLERALDEARQKELMASTARLLAEARLRTLQAQIEPHFLYNTLANVVSLIGSEPDKARHMLERLIDFLRASLSASRANRRRSARSSTWPPPTSTCWPCAWARACAGASRPDDACRALADRADADPAAGRERDHARHRAEGRRRRDRRARAVEGVLRVEVSDDGVGLGARRAAARRRRRPVQPARAPAQPARPARAQLQLLENQPAA
jgi:hypothetical protein